MSQNIQGALVEAIKWGFDYCAIYEEHPGEERIQKYVERIIKMTIYCKVCGRTEIEEPPHPLYKFGPHYFCGFWHWLTFCVKKYWHRQERERKRKEGK